MILDDTPEYKFPSRKKRTCPECGQEMRVKRWYEHGQEVEKLVECENGCYRCHDSYGKES